MNDFIMLNWYHFDLSYYIINKKKNNIKRKKKDKKKEIIDRILYDHQLKIKKD